MANLYSIPQFFGFKKGIADNLLDRGIASEAINVDTTDGALQTTIGRYSYPVEFDGLDMLPVSSIDDTVLIWRRADPPSSIRCVTTGRVFDVNAGLGGLAVQVKAFTAAEQTRLQAFCNSRESTVFQTRIGGLACDILLSPGLRPCVVEDGTDAHDCNIRDFGTGMFLTSDVITAVEMDTQDPALVRKITIGRAMTSEETSRCLYAGVYLMQHENDVEDYTSVYVTDVDVGTTSTEITLENAVEVHVGYYVKVRGGLSDMNVHLFAEYYGRLFAAGDPEHPRRLYWSCLPGDGRTIEDWTADDASPDTGGGHVEVGLSGQIIAIFAMSSQLLIFKEREIYRLYGSLPSQFVLERIFYSESVVLSSHRSLADVYGQPYWVNAEGIWAYNGSSPQRIDSDRSVQDYLREWSLESTRMVGWSALGLSAPVRCEFWNDRLVFSEPQGKSLVVFDLLSGSSTELRFDPYGKAKDFRVLDIGVVYSVYRDAQHPASTWNLLLYGLNNPEFYAGSTLAMDARHKYAEGVPIDAVWESPYMTFGDLSYRKRLLRIGFELTGSVKLTVSSPEGTHFEKVFLDTTNWYRRMEWLTVDMPFETSLRFRFESVDGRPFRIHSGIDCYIDFAKRN